MRFGRCAIWRSKTLADRSRGVESRPTYRCQATEFVRATERLGWWDAKSLLREVSSRNVSLGTFVRVMSRLALDESQRRLGLKSSRPFAPSSESSESTSRED